MLGELLPYGPALAEHCILDAGLQPGVLLAGAAAPGAITHAQFGGLGVNDVDALFAALGRVEAWFAGMEERAPQGFITATVAGVCVGGGRVAGWWGGGGGQGGKGRQAVWQSG